MAEQAKPIQFFLGANTPCGFFSLFDQLENRDGPWHTFLIKGGPGTGKSSFLKEIASRYRATCPNMEIVPCSSDPTSLDAVILPEYCVALVDATAPHAIEPQQPALRQSLLDFGQYLDAMTLKQKRKDLETLYRAAPRCSRLAYNYFAAAQAFLHSRQCIAMGAVLQEKVEHYVQRFVQKNFEKEKHGPVAGGNQEKKRFLTAIHAGGIAVLDGTPKQLCRRLYAIHDEYGAVSSLLLSQLRQAALERGHCVISCYCPMEPYSKIEHLLLPGLGIGFVTANYFHTMEGAGASHHIHAKRFMEQELLRQRKARLNLERKAANQLLEQGQLILGEGRKIHNRLEEQYAAAMDFSFFQSTVDEVERQIKVFAQ